MVAKNRALVLYDGDCPLCRRTASALRRFDWLGQLAFVNCRRTANLPADAQGLGMERLTEQMHVLTPHQKKAHAGFRAIRSIAGRVPILWPIYPLLFIPGVAKLGQRAYLWIARNRFHLLPCTGGVCTIPPRRK